MKYKVLSVFLFFIFVLFVSSTLAEELQLITPQKLQNLKAAQGVLFQQPHGPFAVMLFNESAQGTHLGVIYYKQMSKPVDGKWWISQRFWQERPWNEDITSFAWDKDNKHLYVGTSEVYGNGGLFKLDLYSKTFQRLYPATEEDLGGILSTEIIALDNESGALDILVMLADETTTRVKVSTK